MKNSNEFTLDHVDFGFQAPFANGGSIPPKAQKNLPEVLDLVPLEGSSSLLGPDVPPVPNTSSRGADPDTSSRGTEMTRL